MTHRRIIAILCTTVLLFTQFSFLASAAGKKEISLDESFTDELIVTKVYDGALTSEITFPDFKPEGIRNNHEVVLAANAEYESLNAAEGLAVKLSAFHFTGKDADKYTLKSPDADFTFETTGDITQRKLHVIPEDNETHLTTDTYPINVDYSLNNDDILEGESVSVLEGTELRIEQQGDDYVYAFNEDAGTDNANYILAVQEDAQPDVQRPEAPELEETYLYGETATVLERHDFGIIANGTVRLEIKATEKQDLPMQFTLYVNGSPAANLTSDEGEEYTDDDSDTRYRHTVTFRLEVDPDQTVEFKDIYCHIDNGNSIDSPITFRIRDDETSNALILDTEKPALGADPDTQPKVTYDNREKKIKVSGSVTDSGSGIAKLEYKWGEDKDYEEVPLDAGDDNPNNEVRLDIIETEYNSDKLPESDEGKYKLYLRITDRVGNVCEPEAKSYSEDGADGRDSKPPHATAISLKPADDQRSLKDVLTPYEFGNYFNDAVILTMVVKDRAEGKVASEIQSVSLIDKDADPETVINAEAGENDEYRFNLTKEPRELKNLCVKMTDEYGNSETKTLRELFAELGSADAFAWDTITSDRWVTDINAPHIDVKIDGNIEDEDNLIFGKEGGSINTEISDSDPVADKDLQYIKITYRFMPAGSDQFGDETVVEELTFDSNTEESYEFPLDTASDAFQNGTYVYCFTAKDFAGNSNTETREFEIDHSDPTGYIEVVSPEVRQITYDGGITENWVIEDTSSHAVTFRIHPQTTGSRVKWLNVTVNGHRNRYPYHPEDGYLEISVSKDDIPYDNDCYHVSAQIVTRSRNAATAEYTLHVDTQDPTVQRVTAAKKNNFLQNAINFLTFGAFFNDSVILSVTANDGDYGVGPDYAVFTYKIDDDEIVSDPIYFNNTKSGDEKTVSHDLELLEDPGVVCANVEVKVVDKLGKETIIQPDISDANSDDSSGNNLVMLENVIPAAKLTLPPCEGAARSDNQIWYRHDQEIALGVSDDESGIRDVVLTVNGKPVLKDKNDTPLATAAETGSKNEKITSLSYVFSSEALAELAKNDAGGRYLLECVVTDNAGNVSLTERQEFYRDVTAPEIKSFAFKPYTVDGAEGTSTFVSELRYGFYFRDSAAVVVTVDDTKGGAIASSGNHRMHFRLVSYAGGKETGSTAHDAAIVDNQAECVLPADFKGQVFVKADDMVGNMSEEVTSYALVLDTQAPTVTIEPLPDNAAGKDNNGNSLFTESVSFRVTVTDTQSGLREIVHSQSSERNSYDPVVTAIGDNGETALANGWEITGRDENLITEVTRVFSFSEDDNDIQLTFNATDRSKNTSANAKSTPFTIDTIAPQVTITNPSRLINDRYYQGSTTFTITVTERNFDPTLMIDTIRNTYTSAQPSVSFSSADGSNVHTANVTFPEGDYDFSFTGTDLGGHVTQIYVDGSAEAIPSFHQSFNVDATAPVITTNFDTFNADTNGGNYFKEEKTATITVVEHNFYEPDMRLRVESKSPGSDHSDSDWYEIGAGQAWTDNGDSHSISIPCKDDAVYHISINPQDRAENQGIGAVSPIFEIDTTIPKLYSRNDVLATEKNFVETPYSEVYNEKKKNDPAPKVEFEDNNFERIKIEANIFRPAYKNGMEFDAIVPDKLSDELTTDKYENKVFSVKSFDRDGVYAFTYTAVDKAGNESKPINDTYFRLVDTDLLTYIDNSSKENHSGYYSLMDENGKAISKKATNFSDLEISVITLNEDKAAGKVVLRNDEDTYSTDSHLTEQETAVSETAHILHKTLPGTFFSDTFKDDSLDTRMYLSVSIDDTNYLDLASIHLDNEPPSATLPEDFVSWHNYMFTDSVTVTLTNISETLSEDLTKIYECPREDERVPIEYNYDKANKELSFELSEGLHHIDIVLADEAGNEWNADRVRYLRVGNLRLYLGAGGVLLAGGVVALILFLRKRKLKK